MYTDSERDDKMEDQDKRLERFQSGPPVEIVGTLLNSIDNFYNHQEIDQAATNELWLLVILGIHSVALTITEGVFGKRGEGGFRFFLENFVDENEEGANFSAIAAEIHNMRNVIAHQWLSSSLYGFALDTTINKGWEMRDGILHFNPQRYYEAYSRAFADRGRIWSYDRLLSKQEYQQAKDRLLKKYTAR